MNYLLELREVARKCPNVLRRKQLQNLADDIQSLILSLDEMVMKLEQRQQMEIEGSEEENETFG